MTQTLEQAAKEYRDRLIERDGALRSNGDIIRAFKAGAEWQKENKQMI